MKRTSLLLTSLSVFAIALTGCEVASSSVEPTTSSSSTVEACQVVTPTTRKYALVTDVGTIDDKSFNQGTWEGLVAYAHDHGLTEQTHYKYFQPAGGESAGTTDYVNAINAAISWGANVVVTPGFLFEEAIYISQANHPTVDFILIDGAPHNADYSVYETKSNTVSIVFKEEESGFLAGYAAYADGLVDPGFVGGMAVPAVVRFGIGWVAGYYQAAKEALDADFVYDADYYWYANTFGPSETVATTAEGWYTAGVDVVFAAAGGAGSSVMTAAANKDKVMVGVDVDQSGQSDTVLTSAMKGLGVATYKALENINNDCFSLGGTQLNLGAAGLGVGLPLTDEAWRFDSFSFADYLELYVKVVTNVYDVPATFAELQAFVDALDMDLELTAEKVG